MIHIGQKIKDTVENKGMKKTELARRLNMTSSNIHKIFLRKTIDTGLLSKLSEILDIDFFKYYVRYPEPDKSISLHANEPDIPPYENATEKYAGKIEYQEREISYLKEINAMLREQLKKKN